VRIETDDHQLAVWPEDAACVGQKRGLVVKVMKGVDAEQAFEHRISPGELLRAPLRQQSAGRLGRRMFQHRS